MSDYDRNKFYGKKKFSNPRDLNNFGSRFFNNKATPQKETEETEAKPKTIMKTTILAREHHTLEDRSISPKIPVKEADATPAITIATPIHAESKAPRTKEMTSSVKLLEDGVICSENIQDYLLENEDYLVVGVVGTQGVGKSTLMNLLVHNQITEKLKKAIFNSDVNILNDDMQRLSVSNETKTSKVKQKLNDVVFKLQSDDIASMCSSTYGIDVFITHNRVIFLDCQPFMSEAIMDDFIRSDTKVANMIGEFLPLENSGEIQGLQITAFLMSVCHVLILVQDWFLDSNVVRFIQTAEMVKPTISNLEDELNDQFPHLILLHNKAQMEDFSPRRFSQMQKIYKRLFNKTKMHIESGMGIGTGKILNSLSAETCGDSINLYLIPKYDESTDNLYKGHPPLEELVKHLRSNILGATKYPLNNTNEKHWLVYCSKVWDHIKKSNFFVEYTKLMP